LQTFPGNNRITDFAIFGVVAEYIMEQHFAERARKWEKILVEKAKTDKQKEMLVREFRKGPDSAGANLAF
jgi:hypothetical protein